MTKDQLNCILDSASVCTTLYRHVAMEFSTENVDFLLLVRIANKSFAGCHPRKEIDFPENVKTPEQRAKYIYEHFIAPKSDSEVNISAKLKDAYKTLYEAKTLTPASFVADQTVVIDGVPFTYISAYEEVVRMVVKDTGGRFMATKEYTEASNKDKDYLAKIEFLAEKDPEVGTLSAERWDFSDSIRDGSGKASEPYRLDWVALGEGHRIVAEKEKARKAAHYEKPLPPRPPR